MQESLSLKREKAARGYLCAVGWPTLERACSNLSPLDRNTKVAHICHALKGGLTRDQSTDGNVLQARSSRILLRKTLTSRAYRLWEGSSLERRALQPCHLIT